MPPATALDARRLPFARFERSFTPLFRTYCTDFEALSGFYAGDPWDRDAQGDAAQRAAGAAHDRAAVADVLEMQNAELATGALDEKTHAHLDALRDPEGVAVVTGQQMGLFTGPLYTIYKTLTALQLAERLAEETGRPVAPVFWLEGEDHDFDEIAGAHFLRRNERVEVRLPPPDCPGARNCGPVGRLAFEGAMGAALDELDALLPDSDFKPPLMEAARKAYAPGTPLLPAFAQLLRALLPESGLVFINANDARLKRHAAPLFRQEIEAPRTAAERTQDAGKRLEAQGGHAQINARPANFFLLEEEGRLPIDLTDDGSFSVRGTGRYFSKKELLALLDEAPERFSPNVVLRPLVQDRLLPTAAYVAGPSEVAYFGQLKGVYEHFGAETGVEMPLIYPRASVTLLESKVEKVLEKFALAPPDFEGDLERLFQQIVQQEMDADLDVVFGKAQPPIHQAISRLKPEVEAVDRTLGQSVEAARAEIASALEDLKAKALRAEKRNHDEVRAQLEKAGANLFPGGTPQERTVNVLYFLNKYGGTRLLDDLHAALSLDTRAHQVLSL